MATNIHNKITPTEGIHTPVSYIVSDLTARDSLSGFTVEDGYKLCWVQSESKTYMLTDYSGPTWTELGSGGGGVTDHGDLTGLSDDDHTQYLLVDGSRAVSSNFTVNGNITVSGTVDGYNLSDKFNSLDGEISNLDNDIGSHTSNTSNPHSTSIANIGSGTLAQLNSAISDADLDAAGTARPPTGSAGGDLTGTYPNPTIANDAVTTAKVLDNNITLAKLQTITTDRLLGRDTTGTGNVEQISLNSTLEFTGSGSIQRAALTGDVTSSAGSNATTIANNAVTTAKVLDSNITTAKIADNNITFAKIQTIATDSLLGRDTAGTGNVENITLNSTLEMTGSGSLQRAAISGDITIAAGSNTAAIASGVIVNSDVNASAGINLSKLESISANTLVGNSTGSSAVPATITLNSTLEFNSGALRRAALTGDVTSSAGSNATTLAISGTDGYVLRHNGSNWVSGAIGVLLSRLTASDTTAQTLTFTGNNRFNWAGSTTPVFIVDGSGAIDGATITILFPANALSSIGFSTVVDPNQVMNFEFDDVSKKYELQIQYRSPGYYISSFNKVG